MVEQSINRGKIIVFSAPSGGGKSTIINILRQKYQLSFSISATTRQPRGSEQNGVEYFFLSKEEFEAKIKSEEFVEYKSVYGNYYGSLKCFVDEALVAGKNMLFDIDVQGAMAIKEQYSEAILIFIYPPSIEELRNRLMRRGTDSAEAIEKRLAAATAEIAQKDQYHYQVENSVIDEAVAKIELIFQKHGIK